MLSSYLQGSSLMVHAHHALTHHTFAVYSRSADQLRAKDAAGCSWSRRTTDAPVRLRRDMKSLFRDSTNSDSAITALPPPAPPHAELDRATRQGAAIQTRTANGVDGDPPGAPRPLAHVSPATLLSQQLTHFTATSTKYCALSTEVRLQQGPAPAR